jgi:hypothetical protein
MDRLLRAQFHQASDRLVNAQELVVLGGDLGHAALHVLEDDEVLDVIQQPRRFHHASEHALQAHLADLGLVVDALPLEEVLPGAGHRADPGV